LNIRVEKSIHNTCYVDGTNGEMLALQTFSFFKHKKMHLLFIKENIWHSMSNRFTLSNQGIISRHGSKASTA
jgi:hypothetical protein